MASDRFAIFIILFSFILLSFTECFPISKEKEHAKNHEIIYLSSSNPKEMLFNANEVPELLKIFKEQPGSSMEHIDHLIPDINKIVFVIHVKEPMKREEVIHELSKAVAHYGHLKLNNIKISKYEHDSGIVKMFFPQSWMKGNKTNELLLKSTSEVFPHLIQKRLQNAGNGIKILDIRNGNDNSISDTNGGKVNVQSLFDIKNSEAWQLAILITIGLFAIFCITVVIMFLSSRKIAKDKIRPVEETRHVIVQPILRPVVAGVDVIQPENRDRHITESDSEHTSSPSRSPMRIKGRGLLERRGSNASLTLDLNRSQENISCGTPPKECSTEEYLQSASKRLNHRQLRSSLKDVKALHAEFWEIPMNHPEKVEIAGSGTKNRYKTILPNESTRVHLYENNGDPLSSYINANYVRGYAGEKNAHIATQGPLTHTIDDFWLMTWKEHSSIIVMITKLKEKMKIKCEPYIPEYQDRYGDIDVTVVRVIPREGYTIRELLLKRGGEIRTVHHFWFTTWPDHKTPQTAKQLLAMVLEVEALKHINNGQPKGPMIVHCSAGIGRTGCFIAVSIGIQQLLEENSVDILGIVCSLRMDRGGMVQTAEQYEFVHQALTIFVMTMPESTGD